MNFFWMAEILDPGGIGVGPEDRAQLDYLFSAAYEELRRLASRVEREYPSATLSSAMLVNEAWLKLANARGLPKTSPLHFKRIAARAMRQLLVESARRRNAQKRGGTEQVAVTFDESLGSAAAWETDLLALDSALNALAQFARRQAVKLA